VSGVTLEYGLCGVRVRLVPDSNKARKLKYNLVAAHAQGSGTLLTFGGAYSNHIRAVAAAGEEHGFATIGVIRGEEHRPLNASLASAASRGMRLTYMDRETYREKHSAAVIARLHDEFGDFHLLPEGGSNEAAVRGCAELPAELGPAFDVICCAVGTGGTLAGIAAGLAPGQRAIGFAALKGGFLTAEVAALQRRTYGETVGAWHVEDDFHCGGYAKTNPELREFIAEFEKEHGVVLEPVYVAKMMLGLTRLIEAGRITEGTRLVAVVTSG
jgi:1-aminocyclopropane-1-carboxylate deaminase